MFEWVLLVFLQGAPGVNPAYYFYDEASCERVAQHLRRTDDRVVRADCFPLQTAAPRTATGRVVIPQRKPTS